MRIFLLLMILPLMVRGQWSTTANYDSIRRVADNYSSDTAKVNYYNRVYDEFLWKRQQTGTFLLLRDGLKLARKIGYREGEANLLKSITGFCLNVGNDDYAKKYINECLKIREELHDSVSIVSCYSMMGRIYSNRHQSDSALTAYLIAMKFNERHQSNDRTWKDRIARNYAVVGREYSYLKKDSLAIHYLKQSLQYRKEIDYYDGIVASSNFLRDAYDSTRQYSEAENIMRQFLFYARKEKVIPDISGCFTHLARYRMKAGQYDSARIYLDSAFAYNAKLSRSESQAWQYQLASDLYSRTGDTAKAFRYLNEYLKIKGDKFIEGRLGASGYMQSISEIEAGENRISLQESELARQRIFLIAVVIALLALVAVSVLVYRGYRNKQKANRMLAEKNSIIEAFNKDITDSIQYAQKIQEAVFPPRELKQRLFPQAFVLYQPRDIVSGDFYWFEEKNGLRIIAAADCTGHGVPGAFMSMLGNAFLLQIVKEEETIDPAQVLNKLRDRIIMAMKQQDESRNKDGMDISLCAFAADFRSLKYAGANNPLWIARKNKTSGETEIITIKADKQPVGLSGGAMKPFTCHDIALEPGDMIYLFSDGYADQFGGDENKKFMSRRLRDLFIRIHDLNPEQQEKELLDTHLAWKGKQVQVDDILVIGVRV